MDMPPEMDPPEASQTGSGKTTPPQVRKLVEDLAARYPAPASLSTDDRRRQLRLLAQDIADIAPSLLEKAAEHWAKTSAFMPKAADLRHLAENIAKREPDGKKPLDQATRGNDEIEAKNANFGFRWIQNEHGCRLLPIEDLVKVHGRWQIKPPAPRVSNEEIDAIMAEFGIPSSSTLGKIAGKVRPPLRNPTAEDYAAMGVTPPQQDSPQ